MPSTAKALARRLLPHPLYRRYRRRKVAALIAGFQEREVTHTYGRHTLRVLLADPLGEGWYDHDWEEPKPIAFLRERGVLAPGARVFDLGAHQAIVALMLAREVGSEGHVVAVEAEPHNARVARRNAELNDASNMTVLHAAGAAEPGTLSFAEGLNGQIDEHTSTGNVEVPAVTVDGLAAEHGEPDVVLIDVEGYEGHVLRGAVTTIAHKSCVFMVEVHEELSDFGGTPEEIVAAFADYELLASKGDEDEPVPFNTPPAGRFFLLALPIPSGAS